MQDSFSDSPDNVENATNLIFSACHTFEFDFESENYQREEIQ